MTQKIQHIKQLNDEEILPKDKTELQKEFKEAVPYWDKLNWQMQSNIWNDIRMNSKYGFTLFQRFLKENKPIVIKANGKGVDIINEFQIQFQKVAELFNFSKQQQIKRSAKQKLSKQLDLKLEFNFENVLFQVLRRSFAGKPVTIDYGKEKQEQISISEQTQNNQSNSDLEFLNKTQVKEDKMEQNKRVLKQCKPYFISRLFDYIFNNDSIQKTSQNQLNISNQIKQQQTINKKSKDQQKQKKQQDCDSDFSDLQQQKNQSQRQQVFYKSVKRNIKNKIKNIKILFNKTITYHQAFNLTFFSQRVNRIKKRFKKRMQIQKQPKQISQLIRNNKQLIIDVNIANENSRNQVKNVIDILFDNLKQMPSKKYGIFLQFNLPRDTDIQDAQHLNKINQQKQKIISYSCQQQHKLIEQKQTQTNPLKIKNSSHKLQKEIKDYYSELQKNQLKKESTYSSKDIEI